MAFPADPLPIVQQLLIDGTWTDVVDDTRGAQSIQVVRGYSGEQSQLSSGYCNFTLNNRDGLYTNKNPNSDYYGKIGRNTQYRTGYDTGIVSARFVDGQTVGDTTYDGSTVWTADKASLDITGDIDILVDCEADDWIGRRGHILASKYVRTGNQRSWSLIMDAQGYPTFVWSTDGNAGATLFVTRCPTPAVTSATGRISIRVQFDVNNGAGGWTASFYTAPTASGTFVLLGSTSGSGTTSIFSSSARVELGTIDNGSSWGIASNVTTGDADSFVGKMYVFQLRNALGSGTVAQMDARAQTPGATSWVDGVSTTWNVTGPSCYLESTDFRFWGEIPSLPNRWDITGNDVYIPVQAADIIQRLTSATNSKPLGSPIKRNLEQYAWDGYWAMEDQFDSPIIAATRGSDGTKTNASFEPTPDGFDGSAGALNFTDDTGTAAGACAASAGTPATTTFLVYFKFDTPPSTSTDCNIINWQISGGTASQVSFFVNNTNFSIIIKDRSSNFLANVTSVYGGVVTPGQWIAMRVKLSQSGGNVNWEFAWYMVNDFTFWGFSDSYTGTMGRPARWSSPSFTGKLGLQLAHVAMGSFDFEFTGYEFTGSTNAYQDEHWHARVRRLSKEQSIPVFLIAPIQLNSASDFVHTMGPQPLKTFVDLLQECATVAGGMIFAPRDKFGLTIRGLEPSLNNNVLTLDYSAKHLSGQVQPEPDNFLIQNDVTGQMSDGTTYRYTKTSGPLNVNEPSVDPDGVGEYDVGPVSINVGAQAELVTAVQRQVAQGTVDEARWPQVQVQLERAPFLASADLTAAVRRVDLGRGFTLANLPAFLPPDDAKLMTVGYVETMGTFTHTLNWNTRPRQGWSGGVWGSATTPPTVKSLWGPKYTTLKTGVNSTATSLTFTISNVLETWSTTAEPYDVMIGGERITVTSMAARTGSGPYEQVATVTRSVNGIVKSLDTSSPVTLVDQGRWV